MQLTQIHKVMTALSLPDHLQDDFKSRKDSKGTKKDNDKQVQVPAPEKKKRHGRLPWAAPFVLKIRHSLFLGPIQPLRQLRQLEWALEIRPQVRPTTAHHTMKDGTMAQISRPGSGVAIVFLQ